MDIATAAADLTAFHNSIEDIDEISDDMDIEEILADLEDLAEGALYMELCEHGL